MKIHLPLTLVVFSACGVGIETPSPVDPVTDPDPQLQLKKPEQRMLIPNRPEELTGIPCDVREVLQEACAGCHAQAVYFGSFSTRADLAHVSDRAHERVTSTTAPMPPYGASRQLTVQERVVLADWFAAGAPAGTCGALTAP